MTAVMEHSALLPETAPQPECWGWELEYLIGKVLNYLHLCKKCDSLIISTNFLNTGCNKCEPSAEFHECMVYGSREFRQFLLKKYPMSTASDSYFQTPTLVAMLHACCVDDVNMSHVFDILRINELLDNHMQRITIKQKSQILCAVLGELYIVSRRLKDMEDIQQQRSIVFLDTTRNLILDLLSDTGRDRVTHVKQKYTRFPIVPPLDAGLTGWWQDSHVRPQDDTCHTYPGEELRGDVRLCKCLISGSLLSIWARVEELWISMGYRFSTKIDPSSSLYRDFYNKIHFSFLNVLEHIKRYRELFITRFLDMLCSPLNVSDESCLQQQYQLRQMIVTVIQAFVQAATGRSWRYENEKQKQRIVSCAFLPIQLQESLRSIFTISESPYCIGKSPEVSIEENDMCLSFADRYSFNRTAFANALKFLT